MLREPQLVFKDWGSVFNKLIFLKVTPRLTLGNKWSSRVFSSQFISSPKAFVCGT